MSPGLDVEKSLELSQSTLLLLDNNFNSFNFAFSIATIFSVFIMHFKLGSFCLNICMCKLSSEYVKQIKYKKCESARLGLLTIRVTLKSARVHEHPLPHPLYNTYLKENDQVSADFTFYQKLIGDVLMVTF